MIFLKKENAVSISGIKKSYSEVKALNGVSLEIKKGELFGLLGPNSAGKTTLIKVITGQVKPEFGTVSVLGIDSLTHPVKVREKVGIIPEQETPPSFLSAEEYLYFVSNIRKIKDRKKGIDFWFRYLDFEEQRNILCKDLSRGTRQKLMVAQAFLHEPVLMFIDEPLINLDPIMQKKIKSYFMKFIKSGGTIFLSTHVLEIAEEICTNIGIIDKGKIVYTGTVAQAKKKKHHLGDLFLSLVNE